MDKMSGLNDMQLIRRPTRVLAWNGLLLIQLLMLTTLFVVLANEYAKSLIAPIGLVLLFVWTLGRSFFISYAPTA